MKAIGAENVTVRPFVVHKSQTVQHTSGSTGGSPWFNVATAIGINSSSATAWYNNLRTWSSASAPTNSDGSFVMPLFQSVQNLFYASASTNRGFSGSLFVTGSGSTLFTFPNGDGYFQLPLSQSCYVVNVGQQIFGERIKPGTFVLQEPSNNTSASIIDDKFGRLYVSGADGVANLVGNLFYSCGVGIVQRVTSLPGTEIIGTSGMIFDSGSTLQAAFSASQTIFEYQLVATIRPDEFNFSTNPSATGEGRWEGRGYASGSTIKITDLFLSGTLAPYISTVGFFNNDNQLLAVAKLPRAIQRTQKTQQTFIVRFDV